MAEIQFVVADYPPAKNEAKSMLAAGHQHADRVVALLDAASRALPAHTSSPLFGSSPLGLELIIVAPTPPPSDATNYLGGVADVLEAKTRRGDLPHLGGLAALALYDNDKQFQTVHYEYRPGSPIHYQVRIWTLT